MTTYSFNDCRPNNIGNVPSNRTPQHLIDAWRHEYRCGEKIHIIASRYGKSWSTVKRAVEDIHFGNSPPLSAIKITGYLTDWARI